MTKMGEEWWAAQTRKYAVLAERVAKRDGVRLCAVLAGMNRLQHASYDELQMRRADARATICGQTPSSLGQMLARLGGYGDGSWDYHAPGGDPRAWCDAL